MTYSCGRCGRKYRPPFWCQLSPIGSHEVIHFFGMPTLVDNAIDGDTTAARECFDRMDGKVSQGVDAARGDITVTWVRPAY